MADDSEDPGGFEIEIDDNGDVTVQDDNGNADDWGLRDDNDDQKSHAVRYCLVCDHGCVFYSCGRTLSILSGSYIVDARIRGCVLIVAIIAFIIAAIILVYVGTHIDASTLCSDCITSTYGAQQFATQQFFMSMTRTPMP